MPITDEQARNMANDMAEYLSEAANEVTLYLQAGQLRAGMIRVLEPLADDVTVAEVRTALQAAF